MVERSAFLQGVFDLDARGFILTGPTLERPSRAYLQPAMLARAAPSNSSVQLAKAPPRR